MENRNEVLGCLRLFLPTNKNFFDYDFGIFFIQSVEYALFHAVIEQAHVLEQLVQHLSNNLSMFTLVVFGKYLLEELPHEGLFEGLLLV